jgi:hypothetical protein
MLEVLLKEGPCLLSYFCCCAFRKSPYLCYRCVYFFRITQYIGDTHNARTLISMNTRTQILKIDEATTSALLSTGTSPTTKSTNAIKS